MSKYRCILTEKEVDVTPGNYGFYYELEFAGKTTQIFVCETCIKKLKITWPKPLIAGLIANGKWPDRVFLINKDHISNAGDPVHIENVVLPDYITGISYPKNPGERLDNLLLMIHEMQKIDGEVQYIQFDKDDFWIKGYFQSVDECLFYVKGLHESGLINYTNDRSVTYKSEINLTINGLNRIAELNKSGINSITCFIAMAFSDETAPFREAIKKALEKTGYKIILIDEENVASDKTIPDAILAAIKQSKFCVADFSYHRNGVYFESGYALGLGKPVIYLCEKSQFANAHFDIKQLQHIIYATPEELERKLISKIEAWIK